jgi:hypothetical protein
MLTFYKQPAEKYTIAFDFTDRLPPDRTMSSAAITAIRTDTGADATSTVIDTPTASISGFQVKFTVKAGTTAIDYKCTATVTLDNAHILEEDVLMKVLAI